MINEVQLEFLKYILETEALEKIREARERELLGLRETGTGKVKQTQEELAPLNEIVEEKAKNNKELEAALNFLKVQKKSVEMMKSTAKERLGPELPDEMSESFKKIDVGLDVASETDPEKIDNAIDASDTVLESIDGSLTTLSIKRVTWNNKLSAFEQRLGALKTHSEAGEPSVAEAIIKIETDLSAARELAKKHDYDGASGELKPLATAVLAAENLADDCAHYKSVLTDREDRVGKLANPSGEDAVTKLIDAAKKKLEDAKVMATKEKTDYHGAVGILVPLAQECIDTGWVSNRAERYKELRIKVKNYIVSRKKTPDVPQIKALLSKLEELYEKSDYAKTKDFLASASMLERANQIDNQLFDAAQAYKTFKDQYDRAGRRIKTLKAHKGKDAITGDITRMESDYQFAKTKGEAAEYATGESMSKKIIEDFKAHKKVADEYLDYLDAKKALAKEKQKWDANWTDIIQELSDQVTRFESEAQSSASNKEYPKATERLKEASEFAEMATKQISFQKGIGDAVAQAKDLAKNLDNDFEAAQEAFDQFKNETEQLDDQNVYSQEIQGASDKADGARIYAEAVVPDWENAKSTMAEAMGDIQNIAYWATRRLICAKVREEFKNDYDSLKSTPRGDALKDETDAIDQLLKDAKTTLKNKDINGTQNKLGEARALLVKAEEKAKDHDDFKALKEGEIQRIRDKLWVPTSDKSIKKEVDKWDEDRKAAIKLTEQRKFKEGLEKLQALEYPGQAYEELLADYKDARTKKKYWVEDELHLAKDRPIVADYWKRVQEMRKRLDQMFTKRQFAEAVEYAIRIYKLLKIAGGIYDADEAFKTERKKAEDAIKDLEAVTCPEVENDIKSAEDALLAADKEATAQVYKNAQKIVETIPGNCAEPLKTGKKNKDYQPSLKTASEAVEVLRSDFGKQDTVDLELQALNAELEQAKALAKAADFDGAKKITDALPAKVKIVREGAEKQNKLEETAEQLSQIGSVDATGLDDQISAARGAYETLAGHEGKGAITDALTLLDEALKKARAAAKDDVPEARSQLTQAARDLAQSSASADQWVQMDKQVKVTITEAARIRKDHPVPLALQQRLDTLGRELGLAREAVDRGEFSTGLNMVQSVEKDLRKIDALGKAHATYLVSKGKTDKRLEDLAKHASRFAVAEDVGKIRALVAQATEKSEALDYPAAMKALRDADDILDTAEIRADMSANVDLENDDKIKDLLKKKNGGKLLDDIIKTLDPQTQRKAAKKALELRFDLNLEQYSDTEGKTADTATDVAAPNIMRLYDVMNKLSDEHTKDNPSMALIHRIGDETGTSSFSRATKVVELRVGRPTERNEEHIGLPSELDVIDDDAKPADNIAPEMFNFTTLHEIGHAVDDKLGYMEKNQTAANHGGWKVHGRDLKAIAEAAAGRFKYDANYIESYLAKPGGKLLRPEPANKITQEKWDQRRIEAETWCDSIRSGKSLWNNAAGTKAAKIGDRVYQQSYGWEWVSYNYSARTKGVTGYQFRAPGEWFAELYAAFHTKKMNENHPARKWLEKL